MSFLFIFEQNLKMKRIFIATILMAIFSCSKSENSGNKDVLVSEPEPAPKVVTDPVAEGKSLVEGADCLGCHKVDEKMKIFLVPNLSARNPLTGMNNARVKT